MIKCELLRLVWPASDTHTAAILADRGEFCQAKFLCISLYTHLDLHIHILYIHHNNAIRAIKIWKIISLALQCGVFLFLL